MKQIYVVKIGSSVLLTKRNKLDEFRIDHIATQIASLREAGIGVILVISGAVGCGSRFIALQRNNQFLKRLSAGIGQVFLTSIFHKIFKKKGLQIAQILLTKNNLGSRCEIDRLLKIYVNAGFIPFINENDVVELNSFKGNDFLSAQITTQLRTNKLLILSTMEGSKHGVGGGEAKQEVIKILQRRNIKTDIVNGKVKNILLQTLL